MLKLLKSLKKPWLICLIIAAALLLSLSQKDGSGDLNITMFEGLGSKISSKVSSIESMISSLLSDSKNDVAITSIDSSVTEIAESIKPISENTPVDQKSAHISNYDISKNTISMDVSKQVALKNKRNDSIDSIDSLASQASGISKLSKSKLIAEGKSIIIGSDGVKRVAKVKLGKPGIFLIKDGKLVRVNDKGDSSDSPTESGSDSDLIAVSGIKKEASSRASKLGKSEKGLLGKLKSVTKKAVKTASNAIQKMTNAPYSSKSDSDIEQIKQDDALIAEIQELEKSEKEMEIKKSQPSKAAKSILNPENLPESLPKTIRKGVRTGRVNSDSKTAVSMLRAATRNDSSKNHESQAGSESGSTASNNQDIDIIDVDDESLAALETEENRLAKQELNNEANPVDSPVMRALKRIKSKLYSKIKDFAGSYSVEEKQEASTENEPSKLAKAFERESKKKTNKSKKRKRELTQAEKNDLKYDFRTGLIKAEVLRSRSRLSSDKIKGIRLEFRKSGQVPHIVSLKGEIHDGSYMTKENLARPDNTLPRTRYTIGLTRCHTEDCSRFSIPIHLKNLDIKDSIRIETRRNLEYEVPSLPEVAESEDSENSENRPVFTAWKILAEGMGGIGTISADKVSGKNQLGKNALFDVVSIGNQKSVHASIREIESKSIYGSKINVTVDLSGVFTMGEAGNIGENCSDSENDIVMIQYSGTKKRSRKQVLAAQTDSEGSYDGAFCMNNSELSGAFKVPLMTSTGEREFMLLFQSKKNTAPNMEFKDV